MQIDTETATASVLHWTFWKILRRLEAILAKHEKQSVAFVKLNEFDLLWPSAINLHPPHRDSPPTLGTTGWITHTYMPPYTSSSTKLFSDFSPNHNFKQIQSGQARCPRKDKVSPEQLYFHIKRPFEKSIASPGLDTHTHTLVTSCDDSVSTLSLNLVP